MRTPLVLFVTALLWAGSGAQAGRRSFEWEPVTPDDWVVPSESDSLPWTACVLFEHVTFDETGLLDDKVNVTVYMRERICSPDARSRGDVVVPHFRERQKVDKVCGRTILKDGTEIVLSDEHVFEREVVQTNQRRIKQTAFSLPGLTDDCIIEYSYVVRLKSILGVWHFQEEVPVRRGELHWKPFDFGTLGIYGSLSEGKPNYVILNSQLKCEVEKLPSEAKCSEIVFTFKDIPPLVSEPLALPEATRQLQLQCYYGGSESAKKFWDDEVVMFQEGITALCGQDNQAKRIAATFDTLPTQEAKIAAAYDWVQRELRNASYDPHVERSDLRPSVDEVIQDRQGSTLELNLVFYALLRKMNIEAHFALVSDREERLFVHDAKYWQFDDMVVAVPVKGSQYKYYSPGDAGLCAGLLRWQNEGITTLLCDVVIDQFQATPFSKPEDNRLERRVTVRVNESGGAAGECVEQSWGLTARELKLSRLTTDSVAAVARKTEHLKTELAAQEVSGLTLTSCDNLEYPVEAACSVSYAQPLLPTAGQWLVNPFEFMTQVDHPLTAPTRTTDVMFPFAHQNSEQVIMSFPAGWVPAELPRDTAYTNELGMCKIRYAWSDSILTVSRDFQLKRPRVEAAKYASVQRLFEARAQLSAREVLLGRPGTD